MGALSTELFLVQKFFSPMFTYHIDANKNKPESRDK